MILMTLICLFILADVFLDVFSGRSIFVRLLGGRVSNPRMIAAIAYLILAVAIVVTTTWT